MARYIGPKAKLSRREGTDLFLKSARRSLDSKCKLDVKPGQHGVKSGARTSDYGNQLREKQKVKRMYGILERQFRRYFAEAERRKGNTGETLLRLLEARLDNVVFRIGLARTRSGARQLVSHKHILVNGIVSNSPSHQLRPGDVISVRGKSQSMDVIKDSVANRSPESRRYTWLEFSPDKLEGRFIEYPTRDMIPEKINEQLIVELYSK